MDEQPTASTPPPQLPKKDGWHGMALWKRMLITFVCAATIPFSVNLLMNGHSAAAPQPQVPASACYMAADGELVCP